ncbi:hypothetical protein [Paenibacillus kobensis]|uniref:hypothetical protein n=1 Tax=Paenibacillus kobensis TaxID=59841 RepID=UPI000FDB4B07|nr:hypothetical protein [Paenibacillus kobensis]
MIEWKEYGNTRETQPESHVPKLVYDGKSVKFAIHQISKDRVYRWFDNKGLYVDGVTHYAEINLPMDGEQG